MTVPSDIAIAQHATLLSITLIAETLGEMKGQYRTLRTL